MKASILRQPFDIIDTTLKEAQKWWSLQGGVIWFWPTVRRSMCLPAMWWQRAEVGSGSTNESAGLLNTALSLVESRVSPEVIGVGEF